MISKIAVLVKQYQHGLFLGLCLLVVAGIGYNIGRIWAIHNPQAADAQEANLSGLSNGSKSGDTGASAPIVTPTPIDPRVVASRAAGSKLYHHPWCSGAKRIKEANKLWFSTESEAIAAGYTLAANCPD